MHEKKRSTFIGTALRKSISWESYESTTELYFGLLTNAFVFVISFYLIPKFITNSDIYVRLVGAYTINQILTGLAEKIYWMKYIATIFKYSAIGCFGAGFGNMLANAGFKKYATVSEIFHLSSIIKEWQSGNSFMIFLGAFTLISLFLGVSKLVKINQKDF